MIPFSNLKVNDISYILVSIQSVESTKQEFVYLALSTVTFKLKHDFSLSKILEMVTSGLQNSKVETTI